MTKIFNHGEIWLANLLLIAGSFSILFAISQTQAAGTQQHATVGSYLNSNRNLAPVGYHSSNSGSTWILATPLPLPSDVAANGIQKTQLLGISCDSSGKLCRSIGFYFNINNNIRPLSYTSNNGGVNWTLSAALPLPSNVAATGIQNTQLQGVSCDNTGRLCTTVGSYFTNNNNTAPLSYTSTNGGASWNLGSALTLPNDVAANGVQNTRLQSVACDTTGVNCNAVGFYLKNNNNIAPCVYSSNNSGSTWSLNTSLSLPQDVIATGAQKTELFGVG